MQYVTKLNLVILLVVVGFGYLLYVGQQKKLVAARRKDETASVSGVLTQSQADQIAQQIRIMSSGIVAPSAEKALEIQKRREQLTKAGYLVLANGLAVKS